MNNLEKLYTNYAEDIRLEKDNVHRTEYLLTRFWLDKYLNKKSKILEIGAATGRYAITLAKEGYDVTAVELVKYNLDILNSKITNKMKIKTYLGNALNLSMLAPETFDVILCLGPLYHLSGDERKICIKEALRVAKNDAVLFFAYLPSNFAFVKAINENNEYLINYVQEYDEDFNVTDNKNLFTFMKPNEIEEMMINYGVQKLKHVSTNGISRLIKEKVNAFTNQEFDIWLNYLKQSSDDPYLLGYGQNSLFIGKKINK